MFFFMPPSPPLIYTLSLHDALPISERGAARDGDKRRDRPRLCARRDPRPRRARRNARSRSRARPFAWHRQLCVRSEEHTSELQSLRHLVCRLLLEKKNKNKNKQHTI